jgi:hypothetical protein
VEELEYSVPERLEQFMVSWESGESHVEHFLQVEQELQLLLFLSGKEPKHSSESRVLLPVV